MRMALIVAAMFLTFAVAGAFALSSLSATNIITGPSFSVKSQSNAIGVLPTPLPSPIVGNIIVHVTAKMGNTKHLFNQPPYANFTIKDKPPYTLTYTFDASLSSDPDGYITSYSWDFGDGTVGNGVTVTHTWANEGVYPFKLTVTDNDGASTSLSVQLWVNRY